MFYSLVYSSSLWRNGKVAALYALISGLTPGRVGIFNKSIPRSDGKEKKKPNR